MLELTGWEVSFSFSQLGSDNTPAGEAIDLASFCWGQGLLRIELLIYFKNTPFALPLLKHKGFFSPVILWELAKTPRDKSQKNLMSLEDGVTLSPSKLFMLTLEWFIHYNSDFFPSWYLFSWFFSLTEAPFGKSDSLYSPVNLSNLGALVFPFVLNTLKSLWKIYFSVCSAF